MEEIDIGKLLLQLSFVEIRREVNRLLVGALRPVKHRELYQGYKSIKDYCSDNYFVEISKGLLLLQLLCGDQ